MHAGTTPGWGRRDINPGSQASAAESAQVGAKPLGLGHLYGDSASGHGGFSRRRGLPPLAGPRPASVRKPG